MAPGTEQVVLFTIDDLTGLSALTASFSYHYAKGGSCSGTRALDEELTVPLGEPSLVSVRLRYKVTKGNPPVTCRLYLDSGGGWNMLDVQTIYDSDIGVPQEFIVLNVDPVRHIFIVNCSDKYNSDVWDASYPGGMEFDVPEGS